MGTCLWRFEPREAQNAGKEGSILAESFFEGEGDGEGGASSWFGLDVEGALVTFDDEFDDGEAEARAAGVTGEFGVGAVEAFEDAFAVARGEAFAIVGDVEVNLVGVLVEGEGDLFVPAGVFEGVVEKVDEGGGEGLGVGRDGGELVGEVEFEADLGSFESFVNGFFGTAGDVGGGAGVEVEFQLASLHAGVGEEGFDKVREARVFAGDDIEVFLSAFRVLVVAGGEGVDEHAGGGEGGAEFVGDGGEKVVAELGFFGLAKVGTGREPGEGADESESHGGGGEVEVATTGGYGGCIFVEEAAEFPAGKAGTGGKGEGRGWSIAGDLEGVGEGHFNAEVFVVSFFSSDGGKVF